MELKEVLENLCYYDRRNPDFNFLFFDDNEDELPIPRDNCYCDNCFRGLDDLAVEILRLRNLYKGE